MLCTENSVKSSCLYWIVQWNGNRVDGRAVMKEPDVAPFLADYGVTEAFKGADQALARNPARKLQAASTAINSSLTKCNCTNLGR